MYLDETGGTGPPGSAAGIGSLFAGGGMMGRVMSAWDWAATPVGVPESWPASLRGVVRILLTSRFSMWMAWGPELAFFYNDSYQRDTLRTKHPWALGRPAREVWSEIWPDIGPRIESVLSTGEATWDERLPLRLERSGYPEETYHTFSYSPLTDESAQVAGLLCVVTEDTQRVLGERRLRVLSQLGDVSAVTAPTVPRACEAALDVLRRARLDIPFASIYLLDEARTALRRAAFYGTRDDDAIVPLEVDQARYADEPTWQALSSGAPHLLEGLAEKHPGLFLPTDGPMGHADPDRAVALPLLGAGGGELVGVLFAGASPFRALDEEYRQFLNLVAGQVGKAIADATALQEQRLRAEQLAELDRAKTEFFTGVSHELRTPLTLIRGPAEDALADQADPLSAGQRARVELIWRNSGRLRRLVDTLLEFSRLEGGALAADRTATDLAALTRGIAESFAPAVTRAGLRFRIDCPTLPTLVSVDADMWEKIVLNLLSNAVKFTLSGQVEVVLRRHEQPARVELHVVDTGIGIAESEQPRLFERFHRIRGAAGRSHEGSGIGLALVAELAALHGGTVGVSSAATRGSDFTVTLPADAITEIPTDSRPTRRPASALAGLYRDEAVQWSDSGAAPDGEPATPVAAPIDVGPGTGATVLVAEDNPDLRRFLAGLLSRSYTVLLASTGDVALELARARQPDLILTDVMMPGLDGFALLAALRAEPATAATPVILLSARAGEEAIGAGLAAGADDYLVKPFSSPDLLARVRSNLAMARLRSHEGAWRTALVNALQDGLFVIDPDGSVIEINGAFTAMLGYGTEDLPYRPDHPWWPDPAEDPEGHREVRQAWEAVRANGSGRFLLRLRHRDGRQLWGDCSADTIPDRDGTRKLMVGVVHDVTAQHDAATRDAVLATTGRLFSRPGTVRERLDEFARAVAPVLGDLVLVMLVGPDGRLAPVVAAHPSRPELADAALRLPAHHPPPAHRQRYGSGQAFVLDEPPEPLRGELRAAAPHGRAHSCLVAPMVVGGHLLGVLSLVSTVRRGAHDAADLALAEELGRRITGLLEAERVAEAERRLHDATTALAASASVSEAATALARVVQQAMGTSGCAIYTAHPDHPALLRLVHHVGYSDQVVDTYAAVHTSADIPVAVAARTGEPVWVGSRASWLTDFPHLVAVADADQATALMALPLRVVDRVLGVIVARFDTERAFPLQERDFLTTLAALAAQAFERAELTDAHWRIAQTLQHSLLPGELPTPSRLDLAVHYEQAGRHIRAGGDWYDVIVLDEHRVAIAVGDVVGDGPAAAAVMGQLRSALAAYLLDDNGPARALHLLSQFAQRVDGALGSTAVCLILDTGRGELRWCHAGHPPPLVVQPPSPACGTAQARFLQGADGIVLGVSPQPDGPPWYSEGRLDLVPGSSVLLYTDGLVERRGEVIDDGLARLATVATAHADAPPAGLLAAALEGSCPAAGFTDDVALVVARLLPAPVRERRPAVPQQLGAVRRVVKQWALAAALPEQLTGDLQLALGEALANAVEHAYGDVGIGDVAFELDRGVDGSVRVGVRDWGSWRPAPSENGHRGRGLAMIRALATDVSVDTRGPGTRLRFTLQPSRPETDEG
ncbi:MAG: SpoIIE family protein phosphatase [Pseudonocardia sp.]